MSRGYVLILEDDQGIREMLRLTLELEGFKAHLAADGRQGLQLLSEIPRPDVILLDLMMPVMNGWEFVEELDKDKNFATVPIVVVSANETKAQAVRQDRFLAKPIDIDALIEIVKHFCDRRN